jgi:hypothetical protein
MKTKTLFLLGITVLVVACAPTENQPTEKQCTTAADCVPATCCHASEAVNKAYAPDCTDIFCTAICEAGTLDCGQGEIQCLAGECTVVLS